MQYSKKINGESYEFSLSGKFTREDVEISQQILTYIKEQKPKEVVLNMEALTFIDSSALGQLLFFREAMQALNGKLSLRKPVGHVKDMLRVGNFYELFQIED